MATRGVQGPRLVDGERRTPITALARAPVAWIGWLTAACLPCAPLPLAAAGAAPNLVSFAGQVQEIFDRHCVVCHQAGAAQAGLILEDGEARANLVNVRSSQSALARVVPGKPADSYLVHKLRGTQERVGGTGMRMPLSPPGNRPMAAQDDALIETWIAEGALDN